MIYYQSLQWLPKREIDTLKKIKKNLKLLSNHNVINCSFGIEDEIDLSNYLFQNKKKIKISYRVQTFLSWKNQFF